MPELPPVVATILADYEDFYTANDKAKASMGGVVDAADEATAGVDKLSGSADAAGGSLERVGAAGSKAGAGLDEVADGADAAGGGLERVASAGGAADAGLGAMAASGDTAAASMDRVSESADAASASQEKVAGSAALSRDAMAETGAAAGVMGAGAAKGAEEVKAAESDAESHSGGFSSRVGSMFSKLGCTMGSLGMPFHESVSKMGEDIKDAENHGEGFKSAVTGIGKTLTVVGGVAVAGFAAESAEMADKFDVSQTALRNAITDTGGSFAAVAPKIDDTYGRMAKLGFTDTEVAKSMQSLVIATKSPTVAMGDMATAADLARAKNMSLEATTGMLTKVYAGSTRALTQLGLNLDIGTGKLKSIQSATESVQSAQLAYKTAQDEASEATGSKAVTADDKLTAAHLKLEQANTKLRMDQEAIPKILDTVKSRTEGAAKAYGDTLAGQMKIAGAEVHNVGVAFGEVLLPVLAHAAGAVAGVVQWFMHGSAAAHILEAVIGGPLAIAMAAYIATTIYAGVVTAATWVTGQIEAVASAAVQVASWAAVAAAATAAFIVENAATLGIVAGIALLIAGIVYLATHWTEVWNTIKSVVSAAMDFVKAHLALILVALAPLTAGISLVALAAIELYQHWQQIWGAIASFSESIWGTIKGIFSAALNALKGGVEAVWHTIRSVTETVWNTIKSVLETVWNTIRSVITAVLGTIRSLIEGSWNAVRAVTQNTWGAIRTVIESAWNAIRTVSVALVSAIESAISGAWHAIETATVGTWRAILAVVTEAWHWIENAVSNGVSAVVKFFESLPGKVLDALKALPGDLLHVGEEIMEALIHGVEKLAGAFAGMLKKVILGPAEAVIGAVEGLFSSGGGGGKSRSSGGGGGGSLLSGIGGGGGFGGSVEQEIEKTAIKLGLSANAAAGMVGNAAQESSLNPGEAGGGLYQMSGYPGSDSQGSAAQQTAEAIRLMGSVAAQMNAAKSPAEAAHIMEALWEKPEGSQPGEHSTTNNRPHREQAAEEAAKHIRGAIESASPTVATGALKNTIASSSPTSSSSALKNAIGTTKATSAEQGVKSAIETAKLNLTELKKVFSTAFGELAQMSEKLFKMSLPKGGAKSAELKREEEAHETGEQAAAVSQARESLKSAEASGEASQVIAAQAALNNALYTQKITALKKEAAAEEANLAKQNAAKEQAFKAALSALEHHLAQGKTSTDKSMADIEKLMHKYGLSYAKVGKEDGEGWVKQFEAAIKRAASDSGAITAEIRHDLSAGLKIPGLAAGGIVTSPTLAVVGEAGPEAVIPLSGLSTEQPGALPTASGAPSSTTNATFYTTVNGADKPTPEIAAELYALMRPLLQSV